jgi:hypothetical protein
VRRYAAILGARRPTCCYSASHERRTSQGLAEPSGKETFAATHGILPQLVGYDLVQLAAGYRAVPCRIHRELFGASRQFSRCLSGLPRSRFKKPFVGDHVRSSATGGHASPGPSAPSSTANCEKECHIDASHDPWLLEYTRSRLERGIEIVTTMGDISSLCRDVFEEVEAAHSDREFIASIALKVRPFSLSSNSIRP